MSVKTEYFTEGKNKYTKIQYNNEERIFKVYSARAGNCLCLLSETFPEGITTKNMRDRYGIDDNKLFGELLDQSGFRDYMEHIGTRDRLKVWKILEGIAYGEVVTYGDIAKKISYDMSSQAVGGAVGHNPISIIVPCHRVVGFDGKLTGYAGGLENKVKLLELEGVKIRDLKVIF